MMGQNTALAKFRLFQLIATRMQQPRGLMDPTGKSAIIFSTQQSFP